jgi:N-methylhydantoinase A
MLRLACDVGGTFTDLVVADGDELRLYKSATTPDDPIRGVLAAIALAAQDFGSDTTAFLGKVESFVHATTRAINAVLTGTTARTAFLTTAGHRDILLLREGGRLDPYDNRRPFPKPYVPRALTFEIPERIGAAGEVVRPLDEAAVRAVIAQVRDEQVEAIGVCLLWSIANPVHELRIGELIAELLPGVPFTLSHRLNPILREYRRASATCIDASLKPLMADYLGGLVEQFRAAGFGGRLLAVTSQGGVIAVEDAAAAPIHVLNSGPAMAPVVGSHHARRDAGSDDAIVADAGGTSFDVSLVRDGRIPWTNETWLGAPFTGHMTGFPSVDVKSIGAGGGSIVRLDAAGLLHVGPESAGAEPGPACYGRGATRPTVTDCALVLGLLDPDSFLGGRMPLDGEAARRALADAVARPLGVPVEEAALAALDVLTQNMLGAIEEITVKQGIDPRRTVLVAGGGAAGFNGAAIGRRLGCRATLFPELAAALSASGGILSDMVFSDARIRYVRSDAADPSVISAILDQLAGAAARFLATSGDATRNGIDYWVEARYPQQTWEIEVPLAWPTADRRADIATLVEDFHRAHRSLYAVADPASPVEFIAWRVRASTSLAETGHARLRSATKHAERAHRRVWLGGWKDVAVHELSALASDACLLGPAIVESPFTTIFLPADMRARRLASGTLEVTG